MIAYRAAAVHVRVPATSANLGPGFDALALALALFDDVVARVSDEGLVIDVAGEGAGVARDESHLVVKAMRATFERLGGQPRGLELSCANRIPHGRGLGSSAAAIVGGIILARALVLGAEQALSTDDVLGLAAGLEGHPDNVAACLLGGLTVAWTQERTRAVRLETADWLQPVALVPPESSSTTEARGMLPSTVSHSDAVTNGARCALLIAALRVAPEALLAATEDCLHQQYRAPAMPGSADLVAALRADGLPAVLSGAGPSVLVLARSDLEVERASAHTPEGWRSLDLTVDRVGAHVVPPSR